ncbi:MAG TPA: ribose ABC transporter permease [Halanaerobiales bacterium]|nr:ribose ABC transporter permease [Halanaerobiales bacterium]
MEINKDNLIKFNKKILNCREIFPFAALLGLIVVASFLSPRFLTFVNLRNLLSQVAIIAVLAAGQTYVILTGGIDLSVGSVLAVSGAFTGFLIKTAGFNPYLGIFFGLLLGTICGLISGILVTKMKIPSFVATLAMMAAARGGALIITGGTPISIFPEELTSLASYWGPISGLAFIMLFIYIIGQFILSKTRYGRYIYAIGGNEEAARYTGVQADRVKLFVFAFSGFCAALGGIMMAARLDSAYPTAGEGFELDAIASAVLGGVSFAGGVGSLVGAFLGSLIMAGLNNILNLMRVSAFYQYIARGVVLALAAISLSKGNKFAK